MIMRRAPITQAASQVRHQHCEEGARANVEARSGAGRVRLGAVRFKLGSVLRDPEL
eukprot:CAMPEP_0170289158 /NCGR_PEP_ID=MMETSP0116_2-20130129/44644_1 /TAXON_ID=400756 /ORGANISM="Durinskia baltica, Strain CSIRO CS-38" /LENGTH=55 /DNA_ID=CAMNT_0010540591 /DNA_START=65 /DNA_END=230 /DNA_ORIENTATION=-